MEEEVEQLAQALLREYMHKKGFLKTLQKFDVENPRNERTITSRAVMHCSMHLAPIVGRELGTTNNKKLQVTFMELLCSYRLRKLEKRDSHDPEGHSDSSVEFNSTVKKATETQQNLHKQKKRIKKLKEKIKATTPPTTASAVVASSSFVEVQTLLQLSLVPNPDIGTSTNANEKKTKTVGSKWTPLNDFHFITAMPSGGSGTPTMSGTSMSGNSIKYDAGSGVHLSSNTIGVVNEEIRSPLRSPETKRSSLSSPVLLDSNTTSTTTTNETKKKKRISFGEDVIVEFT